METRNRPHNLVSWKYVSHHLFCNHILGGSSVLRTTFVGIMATASVLSPRRCRCWAEEMCACGFSKALFNMHDNYFICVWRKKNTSPESVQFGARVDQRRLHPCKYPILVRRMLVTGCWQCDVLQWLNNLRTLVVGTAPPLSALSMSVRT